MRVCAVVSEVENENEWPDRVYFDIIHSMHYSCNWSHSPAMQTTGLQTVHKL